MQPRLAAVDLAGLGIEREVLEAQDRRRRPRRAATAQQRAQPRQQLGEVEGLHEVVVGADVEPLDAVVHGVAGGQHQDRRRVARPPRCAGRPRARRCRAAAGRARSRRARAGQGPPGRCDPSSKSLDVVVLHAQRAARARRSLAGSSSITRIFIPAPPWLGHRAACWPPSSWSQGKALFSLVASIPAPIKRSIKRESSRRSAPCRSMSGSGARMGRIGWTARGNGGLAPDRAVRSGRPRAPVSSRFETAPTTAQAAGWRESSAFRGSSMAEQRPLEPRMEVRTLPPELLSSSSRSWVGPFGSLFKRRPSLGRPGTDPRRSRGAANRRGRTRADEDDVVATVATLGGDLVTTPTRVEGLGPRFRVCPRHEEENRCREAHMTTA